MRIDRTSLRWPATLLLAGQLLYVVVTLFHTGGDANHHAGIFAAYAASRTWTAVHVAQFVCVAIMLAGLLALFAALEVDAAVARFAARLGAAATTATLALYGVVVAIDGVALKRAVDAWASAPDAEKAARFATAEALRWLEWGARSYENFTFGLAVLLAALVVRTVLMRRAVASVMGLAGLAYLAQGWLAGVEGFSPAHTSAIVIGELLNATWMAWLLVAAWRMQEPAPHSGPINAAARW